MSGLEERYYVKKVEDPAGKHDDCRFFVLDPEHDLAARSALRMYAYSVIDTHPDLSSDLVRWLDDLTLRGDEG